MTDSATGFEWPLMEPDRFIVLLDSEFTAFKRDYHQAITEQQDLRALLLAWFALFLPEAFSSNLVTRMLEFRLAASEEEDYRNRGWYCLLPLDVALYTLEGDLSLIQNHRYNFDHHKSSIRNVVLYTLGLVAHRLSFGDEELLSRCANNLAHSQGQCEWAAILVLLGNGSAAAKRETLKTWLNSYRLNADNCQLLSELLERGYVSNAYFGGYLDWITRYVTVRMMCQTNFTIPLSKPDSQPMLPGIRKIHTTSLWQKVSEHPLAQASITIDLQS